MKIRVNSNAMKSMFMSSENAFSVPLCARAIITKNGKELAMYASKRVFVIEARTSFPTSIPVLYTCLKVVFAVFVIASKIGEVIEIAVSIIAPTAPKNNEAINTSVRSIPG